MRLHLSTQVRRRFRMGLSLGRISSRQQRTLPLKAPAADQRISGSSDQRISGSSDHCISGSADQRIVGSADQRISGSSDQRISGSADHHPAAQPSSDQRLSGSADQRISGSADRRLSGSADQRISGSADRRIGGSADQRIRQPHDHKSLHQQQHGQHQLLLVSTGTRPTRHHQRPCSKRSQTTKSQIGEFFCMRFFVKNNRVKQGDYDPPAF